MDKTQQYEGFTKRPIMEKGGNKAVKTVGSGINIEEAHNQKLIPPDVQQGKRDITPQENQRAVDANKTIAQNDSKKFVGENWKNLHPDAQAVIEDMHYNMGGPRMKGFVKFQKAAQSSDYGGMADEIENSNYYKQTGKRAKDHVKTLRKLQEDKNNIESEISRQTNGK